MRAFALVFDPAIPNATASHFVEHASSALALRVKLIGLAHSVYPHVRAIVTDVAVQGTSASVSYSFVLGSNQAFIPLTADLSERDGRWIVSAASICQLADAAALANC
jgi:hypothetical protein